MDEERTRPIITERIYERLNKAEPVNFLDESGKNTDRTPLNQTVNSTYLDKKQLPKLYKNIQKLRRKLNERFMIKQCGLKNKRPGWCSRFVKTNFGRE